MSLSHIRYILDDIAQYSRYKEKEKVIKESLSLQEPFFQEVVYHALNPFLQFNTTQVQYLPEEHEDNSSDDIFEILESLSKQRGSSDQEIKHLSRVSSMDRETVEVVNRIVNKDLKCGASIKTFKKFMHIPLHEVMRAESDMDKFFKIHNYNLDKYYWSVKFDGVRTQTTGNGVYLSRNGKEYPNFDVFNNEISELLQTLNEDDILIDGEVVYEGADQHEFQKLMTQIRRLKDIDPSHFKFYIFDIVVDKPFHERYKRLVDAFNNNSFEKIGLVEHHSCKEFDHVQDIKEFANKVISQGYEGLVLKDANSHYEEKKSKHWCKVKQVYPADVEVVGWNYGKGKYKNMIGALKCRFSNGVTFNISGLSDSQREEFMYDTPRVIEMEHQGLTKDGKPRHPEFIRVRDDKGPNEID